MSRKEKDISQSQKILEAAYKCISTRGYASVSLRDIANEADVILSQLTYYYKNKEGLFLEVIKMATNKYLFQLEEHLKGGKNAQDSLNIFIEYYKKVLHEDPYLLKMIFDFISLSLWSESFSSLFKKLFTNAANIIEKYVILDEKVKEKYMNYSSKSISRLILGGLLGISIQTILDVEDENIPTSLEAIEKALFS